MERDRHASAKARGVAYSARDDQLLEEHTRCAPNRHQRATRRLGAATLSVRDAQDACASCSGVKHALQERLVPVGFG